MYMHETAQEPLDIFIQNFITGEFYEKLQSHFSSYSCQACLTMTLREDLQACLHISLNIGERNVWYSSFRET